MDVWIDAIMKMDVLADGLTDGLVGGQIDTIMLGHGMDNEME